MSSITPIPEISIPKSPDLNRYEHQTSPQPAEGFMFAICPICAKVQNDVWVSKKIKVQKMIFCSTNCQVIFQNNVVKISSKKDNVNEVRLGYTGKPENKNEEEYLKMAKEKIQRNW